MNTTQLPAVLKVLSGYGDRRVTINPSDLTLPSIGPGSDHTYHDLIGCGRRNLSGSVSRANCRKRTTLSTEPAEPG